ncbi:hypothetical protein Ancab_007469 [Ancistrocladus abbreviatus]
MRTLARLRYCKALRQDHLLLNGEQTLPMVLGLCKRLALLGYKKHLSRMNISKSIADRSKALAILNTYKVILGEAAREGHEVDHKPKEVERGFVEGGEEFKERRVGGKDFDRS